MDATLAEVVARWRGVGAQFDTGWMMNGPYIVKAVTDAQAGIVERADTYIPALLAATGQAQFVQPEVEPNTAALVGLTGAGYQVAESLSAATVRAKEAVANGLGVPQALDLASSWLARSTLTVLADTMRGAEGIRRYAHDVGYIRMVNGGACGRCVVQAGKWFRSNAGFLRHPRCRCSNIPASEDVAGDWQTNPDDYFRSLTPEQQIKLMGSKANAQAVRDGGDIGQIVNAYRKTSGMRFAQESAIKTQPSFRGGVNKFTTEGTTRRGVAAQQQAGLRRGGPNQVRLMPESIYRNAPSREEALRQMRLYGWIQDDAARTRGRAIFAEQRRVERNARAVARRAERGWYDD